MYRLTHSRASEYHAHLLFSKSCEKVSGLAFRPRVTYECGSRRLKKPASFVLASFRPSTVRRGFSEARTTGGEHPIGCSVSVATVRPRGYVEGLNSLRPCLGRGAFRRARVGRVRSLNFLSLLL